MTYYEVTVLVERIRAICEIETVYEQYLVETDRADSAKRIVRELLDETPMLRSFEVVSATCKNYSGIVIHSIGKEEINWKKESKNISL